MKIKMPLRAQITVEYLLNLLGNAELTDQEYRDITNVIYTIMDIENVDNNIYDSIHQQITELIN